MGGRWGSWKLMELYRFGDIIYVGDIYLFILFTCFLWCYVVCFVYYMLFWVLCVVFYVVILFYFTLPQHLN